MFLKMFSVEPFHKKNSVSNLVYAGAMVSTAHRPGIQNLNRKALYNYSFKPMRSALGIAILNRAFRERS